MRLIFKIFVPGGSFESHSQRTTTLADVNGKVGVYLLPDGQEAFFSKSVLQRFALVNNTITVSTVGLDVLMQAIEEGGSDRPLVPVRKIGKGPTEKSARYEVGVIQKIDVALLQRQDRDCLLLGEHKQTTLEFVLPVSQIEDVDGEQQGAPIWLIKEKLDQKVSTPGGARHRKKMAVVNDFAPATLHAKTSKRVLALKSWISLQHEELLKEFNEAEAKRGQDKDDVEKAILDVAQAIYADLDDKSSQIRASWSVVTEKFAEIRPSVKADKHVFMKVNSLLKSLQEGNSQ